jgi:hypothetical protein
MVADELALDIVERYVRRGDTVLDPFCGSGRLLAAGAHLSGTRVGIDANPLACLLTRAKLAKADVTILRAVVDEIDLIRGRHVRCSIELRLAMHRTHVRTVGNFTVWMLKLGVDLQCRPGTALKGDFDIALRN